MSKIGLIIEREYMTRVRKKSFIIISLLMPIIMLAVTILPTLIMAYSSVTTQKIAVLDETKNYQSVLANTEEIEFSLISDEVEESLRATYQSRGFDAMLHISGVPTDKSNIQLYSEKTLPIDVTRSIEYTLRDKVRHDMIEEFSASSDGVDSLFNAVNNVRVDIATMKQTTDGEAKEDNAAIGIVVGLVAAMLIYFIILISGSQVFTGIMEEKQNRIMEVLASSVKPLDLMMGKIIGIALVTLTQLAMWGVIMGIGSVVLSTNFMPDVSSIESGAEQVAAATGESNPVANVMGMLGTLNIPLLISMFVIYCIGGYLLYASLYAAIAAGCDQPSDAQQLQMPIIIPIIIAIVIVSSFGMKDPNGAAMFWGSMVPLTSPIVMLARIPSGVEAWELILSLVLLVASFLLTTWIAAKIYRVGILMYGKKPTFKDLVKWARMK
ncbi:MAG: ABC transporter permease [Bacteroidales bacterium]|nr:ABC transporter permease [Bacteroidales bacterium]